MIGRKVHAQNHHELLFVGKVDTTDLIVAGEEANGGGSGSSNINTLTNNTDIENTPVLRVRTEATKDQGHLLSE